MYDEELFNIRITRNPTGAYNNDGGISVEEWLAVVASDPELAPRDHLMGRNPATGEAVRVPLNHGAVWHWDSDEEGGIFTWNGGQIRSQWVARDGQEKARSIAEALSASVVFETD